MEPYSYFLPKSYLKDAPVNCNELSLYEPVFTHVEDKEYVEAWWLSSLVVTENGKSISFGIKKQSSSVSFTSYKLSNDGLAISKCRHFNLEQKYEHKLYDYEEEICFLFSSDIFVEEGKSRICISYVRLSDNQLTQDTIVLQYNHLFNQYSCFLSAAEKRLVIITGNYNYGFKKSHTEESETYLDVLSYKLADGISPVVVHHNIEKNVTEVCRRVNIDQVYFTFGGSKLILVSRREHFLLVYSFIEDKFGPVYEWNRKALHGMYECFYVYHQDFGDMFIICECHGTIQVIRENNLDLQLFEEKSLLLSDLGVPDEKFKFMYVDYFENIMIYVIGLTSKELLILDYFQQKIVGKYMPPLNLAIRDVNTNWSGEEVFLLLKETVHECKVGFVLKILFINKRLSLKDISKRAVLQIYSINNLKKMNLPKMLKRGMKLL